MHRKLIAVFLLTIILILSVSSVALGQDDELLQADLLTLGGNTDNLQHPLGKQQWGLRQMALQQRLQGTAVTNGVMRVGPDQFVELGMLHGHSMWITLTAPKPAVDAIDGSSEAFERDHPDAGGLFAAEHGQGGQPDAHEGGENWPFPRGEADSEGSGETEIEVKPAAHGRRSRKAAEVE